MEQTNGHQIPQIEADVDKSTSASTKLISEYTCASIRAHKGQKPASPKFIYERTEIVAKLVITVTIGTTVAFSSSL